MSDSLPKPLFSIITACYNSADTLPQTLQSVKCQIDTTVEHLIIDGGSTDNSLDIAAGVLPTSQIYSGKDEGIYDAMNKGITIARGDIIGILNSDDFYASSGVLKKVAAAFRDINTDASYGDLCYMSANDTKRIVRYWRSNAYDYRNFYWGWMPPHPTFFVRKSIYDRFGLFNLDLGSAADYELMLRFLVRHRLNTAYIPETLVKMRSGGVSNSNLANRLRANRMDRMAWRVNNLRPYPWTLVLKPLRKIGQWMFKEQKVRK